MLGGLVNLCPAHGCWVITDDLARRRGEKVLEAGRVEPNPNEGLAHRGVAEATHSSRSAEIGSTYTRLVSTGASRLHASDGTRVSEIR